MRYAKIIQESWELTAENAKLKWLVFVPSFVGVLVFVLEVAWQMYLYWGEFVTDHEFSFESVQSVFNFLVDNHLLGWMIFSIIFIIFFAFVIPSWVSGALILGVKQKLKHPEKYCSVREKMITAYDYFFRLFELHAIAGIFSLWSVALFVATFYRIFHDSFFQLVWPLFLLYSIVSAIVTIFLSFSAYFIVCEDEGIGTAIKRSVGLVFLNFGRTMSIIFLMFLVNFRVIINVVIVLMVPLALFAAFSYFTSSLILTLFVILGIALLAFTAYLTAILEVFTTAVWTESFLQMRAAEKKLLETEEEA